MISNSTDNFKNHNKYTGMNLFLLFVFFSVEVKRWVFRIVKLAKNLKIWFRIAVVWDLWWCAVTCEIFLAENL